MMIGFGFGFEGDIGRWEVFLSIDIGIQLVIQATFKFTALSGEFLRVQRYFLISSCICGHRFKVGNPR